MFKRKFTFLLIFALFLFLPDKQARAIENLSRAIDYKELFAENLSRGGKTLNLSGKKLGDEGLKILLEQDFIQRLKKIDLRYNVISSKGAKMLALSQPLPKLKTLILRHNFLADEGAVVFANSSSFPNLEALQLGWNEIRDAGALALATSENFPKLKKLDLRGNFLAGKTKDTLRTNLAHLKSLRIFEGH